MGRLRIARTFVFDTITQGAQVTLGIEF